MKVVRMSVILGALSSTVFAQAKPKVAVPSPKAEKNVESLQYPDEFLPTQEQWNEISLGERHFYLQVIRIAILEMSESGYSGPSKEARAGQFLPGGFLAVFGSLFSTVCDAADPVKKKLCAGWFYSGAEKCSATSLGSRLDAFKNKAALKDVDFTCPRGTIACNPLLFCFNQEKKKVHCVDNNDSDETPSCMAAHANSIGVKIKLARRLSVGNNKGGQTPPGVAKNASMGSSETTWRERNMPEKLGGLPQAEIDKRYKAAEEKCKKLQGSFRRDSWYEQAATTLVGAPRHEAWCNGTGMKKESTCQDVISQSGGLDAIKVELDGYCRKNPNSEEYKRSPACTALNAVYNKVQIPISKGEALPGEVDATQKPAAP